MANNNNISEIEKALGFPLPGAYRNFLLKEQAEDDLPVTDLVLLYGTAHLLQRNADYQVQQYLPQYLSIGDDSGGQAVCLHCQYNDPTVYIVGYGALNTGSMAVLGYDFNNWVQNGFSTDIIREAPDVLAFRNSEIAQIRKAYYQLHKALTQLETTRQQGLDLKQYLQQKRALQQQIKDFEEQHAGKKYCP
ncbi:SMI1/KNR4 family protein SUKH-1 [Chitinophaga polysaccharea]|uniref:SMI1/KNR4 family protein SUKH-1 n=1 Tax=Chitinophaga polysaccharea TaxID=1293035 RepID=A0A561P2M4_9BACT|nr:SMI1/KNR4 family protein [Chitinophaga polysaccharea]TWF32371.1 SMI1/KNR4 family protein SUKH-1 [Chitinophaga polysaccharea]